VLLGIYASQELKSEDINKVNSANFVSNLTVKYLSANYRILETESQVLLELPSVRQILNINNGPCL
jgi:hypothetical protein